MSGGRQRSARAVAFVLVAMLGLGSACRTAPWGGAGEEGTGEGETARRPSIEAVALALLPVETWAGSRILRQRVRVEWPSGGESFDAVLQRRPGELALIGLGPMNLVGFRLALVAGGPASEGERAQRIEFENRSGRALPFSPAHILADVQRVFYPWLPEEGDCEGCERSGRRGGVAVWELHARGRLSERRFAIEGRLDAGEVQIRYANWQGEPAYPGRVELDNDWFGYHLTLETLESTAIEDR